MCDEKAKETLEGFRCPLAEDACHADSPAECERFWTCVQEAISRRSKKAAHMPRKSVNRNE